MPIYLQNVRGYSPTVAGAIIVPMAGSQGLGSILSGPIISRTGHYGPVMIAAQFIWTGSLVAQAFYTFTTPIWVICTVGALQGLGTGCCFQPSLVALLAHSRRADRAVLNSLRNSLRTMGGTLGLTVSGTVLNNVLQSRLRDTVPASTISQLASSTHSLASLGLTESQNQSVLAAYEHGMGLIFAIYAPLIGICAIGALIVSDTGLAEKDTSTDLRMNGPEEQSVSNGRSELTVLPRVDISMTK